MFWINLFISAILRVKLKLKRELQRGPSNSVKQHLELHIWARHFSPGWSWVLPIAQSEALMSGRKGWERAVDQRHRSVVRASEIPGRVQWSATAKVGTFQILLLLFYSVREQNIGGNLNRLGRKQRPDPTVDWIKSHREVLATMGWGHQLWQMPST